LKICIKLICMDCCLRRGSKHSLPPTNAKTFLTQNSFKIATRATKVCLTDPRWVC